MALLQDPNKALRQVEQHLDNKANDAFPDAAILAAGNLCRQTAEQIAFILCVYGGVPRSNFLKAKGRIDILDRVLRALDAKDPASGRTYWTLAKRRGERVAKLVKLRAKLDLWRKWFNEPSHYSAPGHHRRVGEKHIRRFVQQLRAVLDPMDFGLVVAAYNEIMSGGTIRAALTTGPENKPAVHQTIVLRIRNIRRSAEGFTLNAPQGPLEIVPDDVEKLPRKLKGPVIVRGELVPVLVRSWVTEHGKPIDLTSFPAILRSLMTTEGERKRMQRHMRKLGVRLKFGKPPTQVELPFSATLATPGAPAGPTTAG